MENTDYETHDFMNVDVESFSQLPFIRTSSHKEKGIRLFGKEFGGGGGDSTSATTIIDVFDTDEDIKADRKTLKESLETSRKFECHYCCRNFPTSQALGGHQNAHKRERQHAKRAHLQSTMVNGSFSQAAQMYGLINYHRFPPPSFNNYHHTNTNIPTNTNRFYQTPINGSPIALWRYPNYVQNPTLINRSPLISSSNEGLRASRNVQRKSGVQDQVSLDLRL